FRILSEPFCDRVVTVKLFSTVFREICLTCGNSPFVCPFIRFHFSCKDLEEGRLCKLVASNESDFVIVIDGKAQVVQNLYSIYRLGEPFHSQHFVSDLAVWTEINVWIFSA